MDDIVQKKSLKHIPYIYILAILSCLQLKQCIGQFHHVSLWKSDPKKSMDQLNKRCTSPFRAASLSSSTCCPARRFNPILCARKTNQVSQWPHGGNWNYKVGPYYSYKWSYMSNINRVITPGKPIYKAIYRGPITPVGPLHSAFRISRWFSCSRYTSESMNLNGRFGGGR